MRMMTFIFDLMRHVYNMLFDIYQSYNVRQILFELELLHFRFKVSKIFLEATIIIFVLNNRFLQPMSEPELGLICQTPVSSVYSVTQHLQYYYS